MIFGKKSLGKVVKKADKELSKVGKMIRQGRCDDALKKLEELYEELAGFPEEEFRKSLEASSTLFRVLYYAAFTCFKAGKCEDCVEWGSKAFDVLKKIMIWQGSPPEKALDYAKAYTESWKLGFILSAAYASMGRYDDALNILKEFIGVSTKDVFPEDLVRSVGDLDRTLVLVRGGRVIRFMTLAAYADIIEEKDRGYYMLTSYYVAQEAIEMSLKIIKDKELFERVRKAYLDHGIPEDVLKADVTAIKNFARGYGLPV